MIEGRKRLEQNEGDALYSHADQGQHFPFPHGGDPQCDEPEKCRYRANQVGDKIKLLAFMHDFALYRLVLIDGYKETDHKLFKTLLLTFRPNSSKFNIAS